MPERSINRRGFIREFAGTIAGLTLLHQLASIAYAQPRVSEDPVHLKFESLARDLRAEGYLDSFVPNSNFDRLFFERALAGTFILRGLESHAYPGTGFFTGNETNLPGFGTARHLFPITAAHVTNVMVKHPRGETNLTLSASIPASDYSRDRDVSLFKCLESYPLGNIPQKIDVRRNYTPPEEAEVMIVGFPYEFAAQSSRETDLTYAPILRVGYSPNGWNLRGAVDFGCSGAPVLIKDTDGAPTAIGVVIGRDSLGETVYCSSIP